MPVFVKISPDMADADMLDVLEVVSEQGLSGIIATNTTLGRPGTLSEIKQEGGVSGKPLRTRANAVIQYLAAEKEVPAYKIYLIGLGKDKPVDSNKTSDGRAKNRRVDIRLMSNTGDTTPGQGPKDNSTSPTANAAPPSSM